MKIGLIGKFYRGIEALAVGLRDSFPACRPVALGSGPVGEVVESSRMGAFVFLHDEGFEELDALLASRAILLSRVERGLDRGVIAAPINDAAAARQLGVHLVENGVRRLFFSGVEAPFCARRADALEALAREAGVCFRREDDEAELVNAISAASAEPVGLVAMNDNKARRLAAAMLERGCAIPDRVRVAGFDNSPPDPAENPLALTSCALPDREQGRIFGELLTRLRSGESLESNCFPVPVTDFYYRRSTLPTRSSARSSRG